MSGLSTEWITKGKLLTFRALALRESEGLTLETSTLESLYGGQFIFSYQLKNQTFIFLFGPL